ncbi:MAG TPA: class I SAM-dependent methyltransferase [Candidatus Paceibacterota bacterium]|nr:class I SAM-dependent methyltransferase [Candidatus Paceibacterota bacterium]
MTSKEQVINFWDKKPCGTNGNIPEFPNLDYFNKIRANRYKKEPFIFSYAQFDKWANKKVLEIGCGVGIDGLEFARNKADYYGLDITPQSIKLAKQYFKLNNFDDGKLIIGDAENLPFPDNFLDYIYSWGVLHHTPDTEKAIAEIFRVLKPEGEFTIMLYNRHSLVALQLYFKYGLFKMKPGVSLKELFSKYHESQGTKAYTNKELLEMFKNFKKVKIVNVVTPYDLRIAKNKYLPSIFAKMVPSKFGFFTIIQGFKE